MLLKLIKMKLRSQRTFFIITACAMPALAILLGISCYMTSHYNENIAFVSAIITTSGAAMFLISTLSLFGIFFAMSFSIMYSVYEMYGTHNAYLYFTLPIKRKTVYHANIISHIIQLAALYCIAIISALIFGLITLPLFRSDLLEVLEVYSTIGDLFGGMYFFWKNQALYRILSVIFQIASGIWSLVSLQLACILGCSLAKKHKLLGSILAMFVINSIMGTASSFLSVFSLFLYSYFPENHYEAVGVIMECLSIILTLAFSVAGYFLATKRLENKFDVE